MLHKNGKYNRDLEVFKNNYSHKKTAGNLIFLYFPAADIILILF